MALEVRAEAILAGICSCDGKNLDWKGNWRLSSRCGVSPKLKSDIILLENVGEKLRDTRYN